MSALATRFGFDPVRLGFGLRTALAALLALVLAWLAGLEHPQWSAMTVWIAAQPVRGHLLEKSLFRLAGTISGTVAGIALVVFAGGQAWVLVAGLALWIGLCAGIGNVQRGFVGYGTLLAGYSAAMVSLLGSGHPEHILALGADRLLTVLVGVLVALAAGWSFTPAYPEDALANRLRQLSARVLRTIAGHLRTPSPATGRLHALLADIAAIDEALDPLGAGSLRSRRVVRSTRRLLASQIALLLWLRDEAQQPPAPAAAHALDQAAAAFEDGRVQAGIASLTDAAAAADLPTALQAALSACASAQHAQADTPDTPAVTLNDTPLLVLHRDWVGAREAGIRAACAMLAVGTLWLASGIAGGPFMLLGTAVMTSLFSPMDEPARMMRPVFIGHLIGIVGALACRWLAWPLAGSEAALIALMAPFILAGGLVHAHRLSAGYSFDYNMVMLILLQPALPLSGDLPHWLGLAAAMLFAPLAAFAAYRLIFPASARRRLHTLMAMMVHELQDMAADPQADRHQHIWRARLYHRLLRLLRWTEKTDERAFSAVDGSLAVLDLGRAILQAQALAHRPGAPAASQRRIDALLRRMRQLGSRPEAALRTLERAARHAGHDPAAAGLARAAHSLSANLAFFQRVAASAHQRKV